MRTTGRPRASLPPVRVYKCGDIFAVVDDGRGYPADYKDLQTLVFERAERFPEGVGCVVIIPANAVPPSGRARHALNCALASVEGRLSALCWVVEGDGFQGAMVQAVLTGVRLLSPVTYPTQVLRDSKIAIGWTLSILRKRDADPSEIDHIWRRLFLGREDLPSL